MDAMAFLTSGTGEFIVGVVCLLIGYKYFKTGLQAKTLGLVKIAGWVLVAVSVASFAGISLWATEEAPPASSVGSFEVTGSDAQAWITVDNNQQLITWAVTWNWTAGAFTGVGGADGLAGAATQTQFCTVTYQVDRGLGTVGFVQTYGDVNSIPSVTNDTTGISYPLLTKTNDQYNALWTRADASTAYVMVTISVDEDHDGETVTLNMTLNGDCIKSMDQYDAVNIGILIGGETWTAQVLLANVS